MAERKRRPPSNKVKPGTPHPTKAYTVRGYDGKWISRKAFNAAKKVRAAKEKGGALVKRTSSAVTKVADKAGELLKIKKGDRGIVRGIKDTYKLGKDTRKSARAAYKAGQITREVYDKLVKGGKDFFGGVKESGKAVKRVTNALKPGGKLVAQAKKFNGVNYDLIPKNIRGQLVKVAKDNGKSKTFKFDYNKIPKDLTKKRTEFKAPEFDKPRKGKVKVDGKTVYTKRDIKGDVKSKVKGAETRVKKNVNKLKSNVKQSWATRPQTNVSKKFQKSGNLQRTEKINKGIRKIIGERKGSAIKGTAKSLLKSFKNPAAWKYAGIDTALNLGVDLAMSPLHKRAAKARGVSVEEYKDYIYSANPFKKAPWEKDKKKKVKSNEPKEKVIRNRRGRVVNKKKSTTRFSDADEKMTKGNVYTTDKDGNFVRITERDQNEAAVLNFLEKQKTNPVKEEKAQPIGTANKTNKEPAKVIGKTDEKSNVNNLKVKDKKKTNVDTRGKQAGTYAAGYIDAKPAKKKRMHSIEKKNREIHGDSAVDRLKQKHKEWKIARKNGTLEKWRAKWKKK